MGKEPIQLRSLVEVEDTCKNFHQGYKMILSKKKILLQITLLFILPLSVFFIAHTQLTDTYIMIKLLHNPDAPPENMLGAFGTSDWSIFMILKSTYLVFILSFSILSISTFAYTVSSPIDVKLTYKQVISNVVPRVWKRMLVILLSNPIILIGYSIPYFLVLFGTRYYMNSSYFCLFATTVVYIMALTYPSILWHFATVITVLEGSYGIQAMIKAKEMIKGNMMLVYGVFVVLHFILYIINFSVSPMQLLPRGTDIGLGARIGFVILYIVSLSVLILVCLMIQTGIYTILRSDHHQEMNELHTKGDQLEVQTPRRNADMKSLQLAVDHV